jgi:hypothetical protein
MVARNRRMPPGKLDEGLRWVVARVALLNLAYFGIEFSVALQSVRRAPDGLAAHRARA